MIFWHKADNSGCNYWRSELPIRNCKPNVTFTEHFNIDDIPKHNTCVFHKALSSSFYLAIEEIQRRGKRFVWELDDDLWNLEENNPGYDFYNLPEVQTALEWIGNHANEIIVSTEPLSKVVRAKFNKLTTVLPNLIEYSEPPLRQSTDRTRILWAGSIHHDDSLKLLVEPLERILGEYPQVEVVFLGAMPIEMTQITKIKHSHLMINAPKHKRVGLINPEFVQPDNWQATINSLQPDICLSPLTKHAFNESKSNIRLLHYALAGGATVASKVTPHDGLPCLLTDDFYSGIKCLLDSPSDRKELAWYANSFVKREWSWESHRADAWRKWFNENI